MSEMISDAEVSVRLALLRGAAEQGASDDDLMMLAGRMNGDRFATFQEKGKGGKDVQLNVGRVHAISPHWEGGTLITFTDLPVGHEKYQLVVEDELHKVARRLRENGWPH